MTEPGLRERKKSATRQAMRTAALRLAQERGVEGFTVEDVAELVDVSPRTFFNYFPTKEDALVGFDTDTVELLAGALASRPAGEHPWAALRGALAELAALLEDRRDEWLARMELLHTNPSLLPRHLLGYEAFERLLVTAVAERSGRDPDHDLAPALVGAAAVATLRTAVMHWKSGGRAASLPRLIATAFDALPAELAGRPA